MGRIEHLAEGVTLYCGDSREILPTFACNDPIVTDPPYGIGFKYHGDFVDHGGEQYRTLIEPMRGRPIALLQYPIEMMRDVVPVLGVPDDVLAWVYPSNTRGRHFRLWGLWGLVADLSAVKQPARNPEVSKVKEMLVNSYSWWEQPQVKNTSREKTEHPCQIPVSSVERIIRLTKVRSFIDPFLGSGTMGIAAVKLGCRFKGIERSTKYFDISCRQIADALERPSMFIEQPKPAKQESML